ncbi:MAG: hypothetical protein WEB60_07215 [Terrimicrobiaceae bacterium]
MQIAVSSLSSLPSYRSVAIPYVVSLPDPDTKVTPDMLPHSCKKLLQLRFHDLDDIEILAPEYRKCLAPQPSHVETIIKFFEQIDSNEKEDVENCAILVHCEAGLSRSAASAIIGLRTLGYDDATAFNIITQANPLSLPNRRMLRFADSIFGDTSLQQIAEEHRVKQFNLAGYEDPVKEIERNHGRSLRAFFLRFFQNSAYALTKRKKDFHQNWKKARLPGEK